MTTSFPKIKKIPGKKTFSNKFEGPDDFIDDSNEMTIKMTNIHNKT